MHVYKHSDKNSERSNDLPENHNANEMSEEFSLNGFLTLAKIILCYESCPMYCRMYSSTLGL